jgi:regulator of replication initiation timing
MNALVSLLRRLDAEALTQLRIEATRLHVENEELRERLSVAEANADHWAREATEQHLQRCEVLGGSPGITQDGALVVAQGGAA